MSSLYDQIGEACKQFGERVGASLKEANDLMATNSRRERGMIQKGIYRHFKGGIYEVIGVAIHTETQDGLVLYRDYENPDSITWARPVSMWNDMVNGKKRFELIERSET